MMPKTYRGPDSPTQPYQSPVSPLGPLFRHDTRVWIVKYENASKLPSIATTPSSPAPIPVIPALPWSLLRSPECYGDPSSNGGVRALPNRVPRTQPRWTSEPLLCRSLNITVASGPHPPTKAPESAHASTERSLCRDNRATQLILPGLTNRTNHSHHLWGRAIMEEGCHMEGNAKRSRKEFHPDIHK